MLTFQKATIADIQDFINIEKKVSGPKTYSGIVTPEEAKKEIEENEVYFIKQDGKIIGSTEYQMKSPDEAYLGGLVIDPEYQGQGIARKAIEFRLNEIRKVKKIWLVTHPENTKVIRLYESYGFKVEERKENYFGDGEPRLVLVKNNL